MPQPKADKISQIDVAELTNELLRKCLDEARAEYAKLGGTDQIAKGPDLYRNLLTARTTSFVEAKKAKVTKRNVRKVSS